MREGVIQRTRKSRHLEPARTRASCSTSSDVSGLTSASTAVEVARSSDAIVVTIEAAGRDLVPLVTIPPLNATARFGFVTLDHRTEVPGLQIVCETVTRLLTT